MCTTDLLFFLVSLLVVHFLSRVFINVTTVLHMAHLWKQLSYTVCTSMHMYRCIYIYVYVFSLDGSHLLYF